MAEQDDPSTLDNILLAVQQAMLAHYKIRPGKVLAYREVGAKKSPVVDVQIATKLVARPQDGDRSEAFSMAEVHNVPLAYFKGGGFTVRAKARRGDYVLLMFADREITTWMTGVGLEYVPAIPGLAHEPNNAIAIPWLSPESDAPLLAPDDRQLVIGDDTGQLCKLTFDSTVGTVSIEAAGTVTVKAATVNVEATGIVKLKASAIQLDTPGLLGGPYFVMGINVGGIGTWTGSNGGGPVVWAPTPGVGATTVMMP